MKEQVFQIQTQQGTVTGIQNIVGGPVVVFFNAGGLHRVGPYRAWTEIARELAKTQISSIRFDLHGLGDSDGEHNPESSVQAVLDAFEKQYGSNRFILVGLCSGADQAHTIARVDERVRGVFFIDGYGYRTLGFFWRRFAARAFSARRWRNWLHRKRQPNGDSTASQLVTTDFRTFPDRDRVQNEILQFLTEGRSLHYAYTAGVPEYYAYKNQFWRMFPRLKPHSRLSTSFFPTTDHSFSLVEDRERLTRQIHAFAKRCSS